MEIISTQLRGCLHLGVDLFEVAGQVRRALEVDGVGRLRQGIRKLPGGPVLQAGLDVADLVLERRRRLERDLVARAREQVDGLADELGGPPTAVRRPQPPPRPRPTLRIELSAARPAGLVPIQFRNHRQEPERIALSVGVLATAAGILLPAACVRIEPDELYVPGGSLARVNLGVDLTGHAVAAGTYGGEVQIAGATVQRIPFDVVVLPQ
jgi:hypothetical protein